MNRDRENTDLLWVCTTCYEVHHGVYDEAAHGPASALIQGLEPLNLIPDDAEVTAGMFWEQHADDCEHAKSRGDDGGECDCERISFTWSRCQGCGSTLGGDREALTVWFPPTPEPSTVESSNPTLERQ